MWGSNTSGQCRRNRGRLGSNTWGQCDVPKDAVFDVILAGVHNSYGLTMQGITEPGPCQEDTNDDGVVEIGDLLIVIDGRGYWP